jgi:rhodanese-related sulfurtransferase
MTPTISASQFRALFQSDLEFAVVDTREISDFYRGHLLASSNLPLSRLELDAPRLIPGRHTRIVLCDLARAEQSAAVLRELGYQDIVLIEGGLSGWHLANGRIFPGWNVIGKAFGDYIEKTRGTPTIDAAELKALIDSASPHIILDTRTLQEHNDYCIPGALHCPNGETLLRAPAAITDPDRLIVTHCAGRTRGIMGAQTLIECGIPNRVVSLGNGTLE